MGEGQSCRWQGLTSSKGETSWCGSLARMPGSVYSNGSWQCWRPWLGFLEVPLCWLQPNQGELQGLVLHSPIARPPLRSSLSLSPAPSCLHQPSSCGVLNHLPLPLSSRCGYGMNCMTYSRGPSLFIFKSLILAMPLLGMYPKELKAESGTGIAALFRIVKR